MRIKPSKRGSNATYDIPLLERKGLLKLPKEKNVTSNYKYQEGYIVLNSQASVPETTVPAMPTTLSSASPFSFLDSLAQSTPPQSSSDEYQKIMVDVAHTKTKLEDLEYKIERILERLEKIETISP